MGIIHLVSSVDDRKVSERASLSPSILVRLWHYKAGGWGRTGGLIGGSRAQDREGCPSYLALPAGQLKVPSW